MQFTDRVGFLNKSNDIQYSPCPRLEDKSLSKHIGFNIKIPDWVESHHVNSQLDTSIHSSTNNGDDNLFKILTVVSIFNNPGVKNVKSDSDLKAWRLIKLPMDRIGFIKGNSCNGSLYDSRVLRGHSLECFGTNVHSPGSKENQKKPVDVTRDRMDSCTKPEESPDFTTETLWDSLPMYDCIRSAKSLVVSNLRFTRECHDTVHMTLQDWTVDTSGGINHEQLLNEAQGTELTLKGNHSYKKHSVLVDGLFSEHFGIKTDKRSVGIRDCDNIQVIVTEQMYIDTFVCISSYNIFVPTTSYSYGSLSGYYYKHIQIILPRHI